MTTPQQETDPEIKEAEETLKHQARMVGMLYRRAAKELTGGLFAESQFFRRLREFSNSEIADIEGVIQDPDHYSR